MIFDRDRFYRMIRLRQARLINYLMNQQISRQIMEILNQFVTIFRIYLYSI